MCCIVLQYSNSVWFYMCTSYIINCTTTNSSVWVSVCVSCDSWVILASIIFGFSYKPVRWCWQFLGRFGPSKAIHGYPISSADRPLLQQQFDDLVVVSAHCNSQRCQTLDQWAIWHLPVSASPDCPKSKLPLTRTRKSALELIRTRRAPTWDVAAAKCKARPQPSLFLTPEDMPPSFIVRFRERNTVLICFDAVCFQSFIPPIIPAWHCSNAQQHREGLQGPRGSCRLGGKYSFGVAVWIRAISQAELEHLQVIVRRCKP